MTTLKSIGTKRLIEVYHATRLNPEGQIEIDTSTTAESPEVAEWWAQVNDRVPHLAQLDSPVVGVVKDQIWIELGAIL